MKNLKQKLYLVSIISAGLIVISLGVNEVFKKAEEFTLIQKAKAVNYFDMSYQVQTVNIVPNQEKELSIEQKIKHYSELYGIDYNVALKVAKCESGLNPRAENVNGSATGLYQFIPCFLALT